MDALEKSIMDKIEKCRVPELPGHVFFDLYRDGDGWYYPMLTPTGKYVIDLEDFIPSKPETVRLLPD